MENEMIILIKNLRAELESDYIRMDSRLLLTQRKLENDVEKMLNDVDKENSLRQAKGLR